jgi:hypothetical protein
MIYATVTEHFANLVHVKIWKLVFRAWTPYFGVPKLSSIHSSPLDPKWCLRMFRMISLTFGTEKDAKLVFRSWMQYFGAPKLRNIHSTPLDSKWCLGVFWEHFDVKRYKTCVSGLYALFRGTTVAKHPFYSIEPKMIYGSDTEHFANLRHVIRWKLVFRSWMHYSGVPK